jgi:hypothetical protein
MPPSRLAAALIACCSLLATCTSGKGAGPSTGSATAEPSAISASVRPLALPPPTKGRESAGAVQARLCRRPPLPNTKAARPAPVPKVIRRVEREVQTVRGLRYIHPVAVRPVTRAELVRGIDQSFDHSYPPRLYGRRGRAWQTMGVIPRNVNLRDALHTFLATQVTGYYDPTTGQLVFIGTPHPSPIQRLALAHELTHADDDQHFNLSRINGLENQCRDEEDMAALGAVEGSAQFFMFQVGRRFLSLGDALSLLFQGGAPPPAGVPPFIQTLLLWPYVDGVSFIAALDARGGLAAVNSAIRDFPVSTEQVIHPEAYPSDRPRPVEVPDLGPRLGRGWRDLDVMDVGEAWLDAMLSPAGVQGAASSAFPDPAAGWDGGQYRAWTDGRHVGVALESVWDSPADADAFAAKAARWLGSRDNAEVGESGSTVTMLFGSDRTVLRRLQHAVS